ncbi:hypothetical protein N0531_02030 [Pseudomonas aeruginosa]|uniref:hypothetical protein n=1 Tax=Pseudomonas aeruginosa TaxID=287 RepID=UPI00071B836C|nr:hypothetical protein [Pseudomonas aeruginosa]ELQ7351502.1 hypothetical protein [Pseudomonas aeruginosa]KSP13065.1 hypothetical protein APB09_11510 [Pseudomonas aeruginosa]MBH3725961.1 hypothetical protein [Pseudomonas aeruginosa]MBH3773743.1 hypothetical protein [Pseudomonas aeruginosa]MBH9148686.1 hypothetical protein [Pseudomonas aeruginosa]
MATVTHVLSGAGEPLDPPPSIGAHYVNTNNGALYLAKGTSSGADWVKLGSGGGSAPSEVLHVNTDGQFLLEPQHSFVEARLFAIPELGTAAIGIDPSTSRQFDLNLRTAAPSGQQLQIRVTSGELPGGMSIVGTSRQWAVQESYGFVINANDLNGEVWARVYFDADELTLSMLVFSDVPNA